MHVLIIPDSFKGSITSVGAAACIEAGICKVFPDCDTKQVPVSDGGEGTVEAMITAAGGNYQFRIVEGPLGEPVRAAFGVLPDGTAIIEMAQASGLPLVPADRMDPSRTTTFGTGQLIRAALDIGCRKIFVGLGGSATNDGGAGMARALGVRFLSSDGKELDGSGSSLEQLCRIDISALDPRISETEFLVASDVTNPLCGKQGASYVYGPQKGADTEMVQRLDAALMLYSRHLQNLYKRDFADIPGSGAAGGLGAGLMAFCGASVYPGFSIISDLLGLEPEVRKADLVFTGEGRVDSTSANGKLLTGIGMLAKKYSKPLIVLTGEIGRGAEKTYSLGVSAILSIADGPISLEESIQATPQLITDAAERAARLIKIGKKMI